MFLAPGGEQGEQECSDSVTGLWVQTRGGTQVRVRLPRGALAFQAGECLQILSGGLLQATPHMVRGAPDGCGLSRNTFALFMQPSADYELHAGGASATDVDVARWEPGMTFGVFSERTFSAYYN